MPDHDVVEHITTIEPPRVYDGLGRIISAQTPALPASMASRAARMQAQLPRALAALATTTGVAQPKTTGRAWVEGLVLSPSGSAARSAALAAKFGQSLRTPEGWSEYTVRNDSVTTTVDVDPSIGAVVGRVERVNGIVHRRWTTGYVKAADGTATKSETRVETPAVGGKRLSRVTVTRYSNVHFEKRIGL